jgi:hypothetical protein
LKIRWVLGLALILTLSLAPAPARADELLEWQEGERVVYSNTPSSSGARVVKGFESKKRAATVSTPGARIPSPIPVDPRSGYDAFINQVARDNDLEPSLIKAVAHVESGFNPQAISPKGARGLMQLMPATARQYGVTNIMDPHENLRAGAQHLRDLLNEFNGDEPLALAAYNAGSGAVHRYNGIPRYRETQDYVRKVQERRSLLTQGSGSASTARQAAPVVEQQTAGDVQLERHGDGRITLSN